MEKQIVIGGRYQVIRKIGEGGMAKVYLVYDTKLEMNLALKILRKENVVEKKVRNFKREAIALSMMDDENIVRVFDVGEEGNIHYIATEYVDGMTMKDYIMNCSPVPIDEVIKMSEQVLKGIQHAHEKGVIHKDVKSQNILLDEDREVKITDFGIASIMDEDFTKTQSLLGTPQYVAPEILNRDILTEQSDIYSIGILMFELLVGKAPFNGEKPGIIMIKQLNQPLPSIISERPDVPQSLENVVVKATAKRLENRYRSTQEMLDDLETVLSPERKFENKVILVDDIISDDKVEKTVVLNNELDFDKIKNETKQSNKNSNIKKIFLSITLLIAALLIIFVMLFSQPPIKMPNLVNVEEGEAVSQLIITGISDTQIEVKKEASEDVKAGYIISTTPEAEEIIDEDSTILLTVSTGLEKNVFQSYESRLISTIQPELEEAGYIVEVVNVDSTSPVGTIISQEPAAGSNITRGSTLTFEVSTGNFTVKFPNFTGLDLPAVDDWASDYNIGVSTEYACNDNFDKDKIYNQEPNINDEITNGGSVKVYISDGACATTPEEGTPTEPVATDPVTDTTTDPTTETPTEAV